jgi:hypothetical protein
LSNQNKNTRESADYTLFTKVIQEYCASRYQASVSPIQAITYDPLDAKKRRNPVYSIDFCIDVEHAVNVAVGQNPLHTACFAQIIMETCGEDINPDYSLTCRADVVERCARAFRARHLAPSKYFKPRVK